MVPVPCVPGRIIRCVRGFVGRDLHSDMHDRPLLHRGFNGSCCLPCGQVRRDDGADDSRVHRAVHRGIFLHRGVGQRDRGGMQLRWWRVLPRRFICNRRRRVPCGELVWRWHKPCHAVHLQRGVLLQLHVVDWVRRVGWHVCRVHGRQQLRWSGVAGRRVYLQPWLLQQLYVVVELCGDCVDVHRVRCRVKYKYKYKIYL